MFCRLNALLACFCKGATCVKKVSPGPRWSLHWLKKVRPLAKGLHPVLHTAFRHRTLYMSTVGC